MTSREQEFEQVALIHTRSLLRFARRLTQSTPAAEDLVQETLLLAWRGFDGFAAGTNARAWLFRILVNAFQGQERKRRTAGRAVAMEAAGGSEPGTEESVEVMQALDRLPEEQRTVLLLAAVEGFTCREIGGILGAPVGTVMSRLSRSREAMRQLLGRPGKRERVER